MQLLASSEGNVTTTAGISAAFVASSESNVHHHGRDCFVSGIAALKQMISLTSIGKKHVRSVGAPGSVGVPDFIWAVSVTHQRFVCFDGFCIVESALKLRTTMRGIVKIEALLHMRVNVLYEGRQNPRSCMLKRRSFNLALSHV